LQKNKGFVLACYNESGSQTPTRELIMLADLLVGWEEVYFSRTQFGDWCLHHLRSQCLG